MHNQFANAFYKSAAWRRTRKVYFISRRGLCERCLARGLIVPGEQVHHKIELTPENIRDPRVTLNPDNLELLCRDCHLMEHGARRWTVDPTGHVEAR